ncbi:MAG: GNAT family N-acetyltransferase [Ruminococcaceae bacterium]|nr:GNAT family N-acetyltransferase [Oscillospiraceae bacterium]
MQIELLELTTQNELLPLYNVYKGCMYLPNEDKYREKVQSWLMDDWIRIFACVHGSKRKSLLVLKFTSTDQAEIIGISVEEGSRNQGIGSFMIREIQLRFPNIKLNAETDRDAVVFYKKNGFQITEIQKNYNGETVTRYLCVKK